MGDLHMHLRADLNSLCHVSKNNLCVILSKLKSPCEVNRATKWVKHSSADISVNIPINYAAAMISARELQAIDNLKS